jgi:hypothetical protein
MVLGPPALAEGGLGEGGGDVKWLPYHRITIVTTLTPDDVNRRLREEIGAAHWFTPGRDEGEFSGEVGKEQFLLTRNLNTETASYFQRNFNSFQAMITGRVRPHQNGSAVDVEMTMGCFPLAFLILWSAPLLAVSAYLAYRVVLGEPPQIWSLLPLVLLMVGWGGANFFFWEDAESQESFIRALIERE